MGKTIDILSISIYVWSIIISIITQMTSPLQSTLFHECIKYNSYLCMLSTILSNYFSQHMYCWYLWGVLNLNTCTCAHGILNIMSVMSPSSEIECHHTLLMTMKHNLICMYVCMSLNYSHTMSCILTCYSLLVMSEGIATSAAAFSIYSICYTCRIIIVFCSTAHMHAWASYSFIGLCSTDHNTV